MTEPPLDIVALVQNNPLTKLTSDYGSEIISKIKQHFTDKDQQFFVANFYCYLNYNTRKDYVIDLDFIWKWIGFDKKSNCKSLLVNNFKVDIDYKITLSGQEDYDGFAASAAKPIKPLKEPKTVIQDQYDGFAASGQEEHKINCAASAAKYTKPLKEPKTVIQEENDGSALSGQEEHKKAAAALAAAGIKPLKELETRGGSNKETILLTVHCFKKLCLKAKTKKSDQIHEYYVNLEEIMNELVAEQTSELILKLQIKDNQLKVKDKSLMGDVYLTMSLDRNSCNVLCHI